MNAPAGDVAGAGGRLSERMALLLAVAVAAAPHWRALTAGLSYYFRDFSVTFYPLRLFQARELAEGRLAFWNPYIHQGSFLLPALYPPELLHALWPGPAAVSWLLTLHVPLASASAYLLARELGATRAGAVVGGALYALGGLAASSVNLYVFLQALAWAPALAASARRAGRAGGRWVAVLAAVSGLSLSTMAVEFVAQAMLLGVALALAARPGARAAARVLAGLALGAALASVPLAVTAGFMSETVRAQGFERAVALGNELHPVGLLQVLVPDLFGSLDAPAELWWGGRFFTKGFPYFLSIHVGAVALALAALGWPALPRRARLVVGGLALLALWYSLGVRGGLAPLLQAVPAFRWFRFPSKALLLPYLALAPAAALGFDRLRAGEAWPAAQRWLLALAALSAVPAAAVALGRGQVGAWSQAPDWALGRVLAASLTAGATAAVAAALAVAVRRRAVAARTAGVLLAAIAIADVARAHAGMNPQVSPRFYEALPEMAALRLPAAGRVFSYGPDESPAFRGLLAGGRPGIGLWSFFLNRQLLGPYNNVLDRVETPDAKDLTALVPRPALFTREDYDPAAVSGVVPGLRHASVAHVLSLDPLSHPALLPRASIATGASGLEIRVYTLVGALPRAYVACRAVSAPTLEAALSLPFAPGFDPARDVALEAAGAAAECGAASARRIETGRPDTAGYEVESDGRGILVMRERYARGWSARVDGVATPVLRANGLHRAVPVAAGRHLVTLAYHPPALAAGVATLLAGVAGLVGVLVWPRLL